MPHGKFRHEDHRFEWTRTEFNDFVTETLKKYQNYTVTFDGIGKHWGGDESLGFCSQGKTFILSFSLFLLYNGSITCV